MIFAPLLLKEKVFALSVVSTAIIIIGASIAVVFAPHKDTVYSISELFDFFNSTAWLIYMVIILVYCLIGWYFVNKTEKMANTSPTIKRFQRFIYPSISGSIGAQSVLYAKCVVELLINSFSGHGNLWVHFQTYLVTCCMFTTIMLQIKWLNDGLKKFDASYTVPVFTSFWILLSVISGLIFYKEYEGMNPFQMVMFLIGVATTVTGVIMLSRRELNDGYHKNNGMDNGLVLDERTCDEDDNLHTMSMNSNGHLDAKDPSFDCLKNGDDDYDNDYDHDDDDDDDDESDKSDADFPKD